MRPAAIFRSVDLPEPLRPTRHRRSPAGTESPAASSKGMPPKVSAISCKSRRGGDIRVLGFGKLPHLALAFSTTAETFSKPCRQYGHAASSPVQHGGYQHGFCLVQRPLE